MHAMRHSHDASNGCQESQAQQEVVKMMQARQDAVGMLNDEGDARLIVPVKNPDEEWCADLIDEDGSTTMCDWATLEMTGVVDLLRFQPLNDEELRSELGLE